MKIKNLLLPGFVILISISITSAQPIIQWQKCLGGSGEDFASSIQQTNDGGYIVAGGSFSNDGDVSGNHGSVDYWVVKLTSLGIMEWQKSLGGSSSDQATSIQQTNEGGYIVAGFTYSTDGEVSGIYGGYDCWVVKLSNIGTIEWRKLLGGSASDIAQEIQQTNDGGYIVAGKSESNDGDVSGNHGGGDYWVVKLNNIGAIEWQKTIGGTGYDRILSIQQTNDEGYIVAGESNSIDGNVSGNNGNYDYWVVKLNNIGIIEWQKSLGGSGKDRAYSIQQTNDGGYIVAGSSESNDGDVSGNHGSSDYCVVKLSSIGTIEWQKSLGGSEVDYATSIQQTTDGGYIIAGESFSNDGDVTDNRGFSDCWVVQLTSVGIIDWQKSIGGSGEEAASSIKQTNDGGFIYTGGSISNDGDVSGNHGDADSWVVKLNSSQLSIENSEPELFSVFPNPAQSSINVKADNKLIGKSYAINDNTGKIVLSGKINSEKTAIEIGNLSGGIYLFSVGENLKQTFKIIKE
jgi:hypothetical protein